MTVTTPCGREGLHDFSLLSIRYVRSAGTGCGGTGRGLRERPVGRPRGRPTDGGGRRPRQPARAWLPCGSPGVARGSPRSHFPGPAHGSFATAPSLRPACPPAPTAHPRTPRGAPRTHAATRAHARAYRRRTPHRRPAAAATRAPGKGVAYGRRRRASPRAPARRVRRLSPFPTPHTDPGRGRPAGRATGARHRACTRHRYPAPWSGAYAGRTTARHSGRARRAPAGRGRGPAPAADGPPRAPPRRAGAAPQAPAGPRKPAARPRSAARPTTRTTRRPVRQHRRQ